MGTFFPMFPSVETPPTRIPLHDLIVQTRNEIDRRGHAKNWLQDSRDRVCLIGGFNLAVTGDALTFASSFDRHAFAHALGFANLEQLVNWNNKRERTIDEVLARLDKAANDTAPAPADPLVTITSRREPVGFADSDVRELQPVG